VVVLAIETLAPGRLSPLALSTTTPEIDPVS
jgi:hypothetical protein